VWHLPSLTCMTCLTPVGSGSHTTHIETQAFYQC
jgi:hypothetical protein